MMMTMMMMGRQEKVRLGRIYVYYNMLDGDRGLIALFRIHETSQDLPGMCNEDEKDDLCYVDDQPEDKRSTCTFDVHFIDVVL